MSLFVRPAHAESEAYAIGLDSESLAGGNGLRRLPPTPLMDVGLCYHRPGKLACTTRAALLPCRGRRAVVVNGSRDAPCR